LGIAEGESVAVGIAFELIHLCHRAGHTRAKFLQKFFGLLAQLLQVWLLR
jgi:hypothetical protein